MITAADLRKLMPLNETHICQEIENHVIQRAQQGYTHARIDALLGDDLIRAYFGVKDTPEHRLVDRILNRLEEAGYTVSEIYVAGQFVDAGICVSWAE